MKLSKSQGRVLYVLIMVAAMSCIMSLAMTIANTGFGSGFLHRWTRSWGLGFIVALPTAALVVPVAQRVVRSVTE